MLFSPPHAVLTSTACGWLEHSLVERSCDPSAGRARPAQVYVSGDEGRGQDQDSREGTWVQVRPVQGAFTVNIGDMMQVRRLQ